MLIAAESKREEEKAKGVSNDDASDNPDIVLFEDNEEEEEEEESEEEEDSIGQGGAQGRGRGRGGMMWQGHMPMARGGRPFLRGFPPVMMGGDGFGYPDSFGTPDMFGVPPRGMMFGGYGPRFGGGDFGGGGMMFPGRPPQPGPVFSMGMGGMMMGNANRPPFMGGMPGGMGRPGRPSQSSPFLHPQPPPPPLPNNNNNRIVKKDQSRMANDSRYEVATDGGGGDKFVGSRSSLQNEESESEDEAAPRRSRYGEGSKKKRWESEAEAGSEQWETPGTEAQNQ